MHFLSYPAIQDAVRAPAGLSDGPTVGYDRPMQPESDG